MPDKINIQGLEISIKKVNEQDFVSLTDMAKNQKEDEPRYAIRGWLRNQSTVQFLEAWEKRFNPNFKQGQMDAFKIEWVDNRSISIQRYIEIAKPIGLVSKSGRYGGTFAHIHIALEFATWLNAEFKVAFIADYEKLKTEEAKHLDQNWTFSRFLSKVNYSLQTQSIRENLVPKLQSADKPYVYANEADMLNSIVFGMTAREWREQNSTAKGNIRDSASELELIILTNMQARNSELIDNGVDQELRFQVLVQIAQKQIERLSKDKRLSDPKNSHNLDT